MFIFLSYAREDSELAERIRRTIAAAGFECFLDASSLPAGQEYNARIGQAIARADLFIFLLSTAALEPGSYALTELAFAEKKWRNPAGYVLPVASTTLDLGSLPAYLRPINVLKPRGNIEAEVLAWIQDRAEHGGGGSAEPTSRDRLTSWVRQHQPPLRRQRRVVAGGFVGIVFGLAFIGFGVVASSVVASSVVASSFGGSVRVALMVIPALVGVLMIVYSLIQLVRGLVGAKPFAAVVLERSQRGGVTVHLLLTDDTRKAYYAVGRAAENVYSGDIGWAFVTGRLLLGFEHGQRPQSESERSQ